MNTQELKREYFKRTTEEIEVNGTGAVYLPVTCINESFISTLAAIILNNAKKVVHCYDLTVPDTTKVGLKKVAQGKKIAEVEVEMQSIILDNVGNIEILVDVLDTVIGGTYTFMITWANKKLTKEMKTFFDEICLADKGIPLLTYMRRAENPCAVCEDVDCENCNLCD